jgi:hypothetical protein
VPWIAPDEMVYGLVGRSLYQTGKLAILGGPTPFYSALTPVLAGAPLSIGDLQFGYGLLKVLQALVMSLTAIPVYLWGRSLVRARWALIAAALTLAAPALVYSGLVMTEVLFYPFFLAAAWSMARVLEQPSRQRQALMVVAVAATVATRLQAVVLLPAFATALGLDAVLARSMRVLRSLVPALAAMMLLAVGGIAWRLGSGEPVLGGYGVVTHIAYGAGRAARFVLYHAGSLVILTGVFPACALLLLLIGAARRGEPDRNARAYLAVAGSLSAWLVVEVGVFASHYVGRLAERDLIGLAPLLFLGLALWLERGGPRGYWPMSIAGVLVAAPLVALPLKRLVTAYAPPDAPSLVPLYDLLKTTSLSTLEYAFFAVAGAAIVAFALIPRRWLAVLPLVLLAGLIASSVAASRFAADQGRLRQAAFLGPDPRWIDHAADGPVAYLYQAGDDWTGVWETVFWNRRVDRVYGLGGARVFGPMPQQAITIRSDGLVTTGRATQLRVRYVVVATGVVSSEPAFGFLGEAIGQTHQPGSQQEGLSLWRVAPPLRVAFRTSGLKPNGDVDSGGDARIVGYGCGRGVFQVTLLIKQAQTVTILRNGIVYRRLHFASPGPNQPWRGTIPALPPAGRPSGHSECRLDVRPSGLLGTTVFQLTQ